MQPGAASAAAVAAAVADAHRGAWAQVLAATVRVTGDLEVAEECVQDAYARALATWPAGIPANPAAVCQFMKMITLPKLRDALRDGGPVVSVDPQIADRARIPIERMVALG